MSTPVDQAQAQFEIRKIYVKDVSLETPHSPAIFLEQWAPETKIQLHSESKLVQEDLHEVVLRVTITATIKDKTAFLVEVKQAAVVLAKGFESEQQGRLLGAFVPAQLYPLAREAISALVTKGGFPQMLLAPVNFDAIYALQLKQAKDSSTAQPAAVTTAH